MAGGWGTPNRPLKVLEKRENVFFPKKAEPRKTKGYMVGKARYKAKMFPPGPHGGCSRFSVSASGRNCQTSLGHCSYSRLRRLEEKGSTPMPASTKQQSEERATSATHASPEPAGGRATAGRTRDTGPSARPCLRGGKEKGSPTHKLKGRAAARPRWMGWGDVWAGVAPGGLGVRGAA